MPNYNYDYSNQPYGSGGGSFNFPSFEQLLPRDLISFLTNERMRTTAQPLAEQGRQFDVGTQFAREQEANKNRYLDQMMQQQRQETMFSQARNLADQRNQNQANLWAQGMAIQDPRAGQTLMEMTDNTLSDYDNKKMWLNTPTFMGGIRARR